MFVMLIRCDGRHEGGSCAGSLPAPPRGFWRRWAPLRPRARALQPLRPGTLRLFRTRRPGAANADASAWLGRRVRGDVLVLDTLARGIPEYATRFLAASPGPSSAFDTASLVASSVSRLEP